MKENLAKREFELIGRIVDRATELGIVNGSRLNYFMDITYANDVFDIDLEAWLNTDKNNFVHDFVGICSEINRDSIISKKGIADKSDFDWFVPRFARKNKLKDLSKECLECAEMLTDPEAENAEYKAMKALKRAASKMNEVDLKYHKGIKVVSQENDADDEILCPLCYCSIARNDDNEEMKPKHCPECGIKLIY